MVPALALVIVECADGWAARASVHEPVKLLFPEEVPCADCMQIFEAMTTQDPELWPDAPLTQEEKLCGDCDKLHKYWHLDVDLLGSLFVFRDKCTCWFVLREGKLFLVLPPDVCGTCRALVQSWGRVQIMRSRSIHVHH